MTRPGADRGAVEWLSRQWSGAGVKRGDLLLLHSSTRATLRRLKKRGFAMEVQTILDSFIDAVGESGTLLLPLFNFDFCRGAPFDIRTTPSQMGALTEAGRLREGAVRTGHPIYSFAALGSKSESFRGVDNFSAYGPDSPFGRLHQQGGKIAVLDLPDQRSMTFYHYVEESLGVDYRYHKQFSGQYANAAGQVSEREYGLFVRRIDAGVVTRVDAMGELLWAKGLYRGGRPGQGSGLRVIDVQGLYDEVAGVIRQGKAKGMLYEIDTDIGTGIDVDSEKDAG